MDGGVMVENSINCLKHLGISVAQVLHVGIITED